MPEAIHPESNGFNSADRSPILSAMEQFAVTDRAAARIAEIVAETRPAEDVALRVAVLAGGCSGFQYLFELYLQTQPDDLIIPRGPARVVVQTVSMEMLSGSELDYTDELIGSHF